VRLREGRDDARTVFSDDPVGMAERWAAAGAERLHVVDLDGAFAGAPRQTALIAKIVEAVRPIPVEAGGGLRDRAAVEAVLDAGAAWAVVGTSALDPAFLADVCPRFGPRVIVAVDARDGRVAVKGWVDVSDFEPVQLAHAVRDAGGAAALLYTDIRRDGTAQGPNVTATAKLAAESRMPVIASGGVARVEDLTTLARVPGVLGAVVGRAIYTGDIDLASAIRAVRAV
jgi:phosphoribosylformimino-5-aminoimidazole carboxamide ribotide isomerase